MSNYKLKTPASNNVQKQNFYFYFYCDNSNLTPRPASAVEEHQNMKRKDPCSAPDKGLEFLSMKWKNLIM